MSRFLTCRVLPGWRQHSAEHRLFAIKPTLPRVVAQASALAWLALDSSVSFFIPIR